jgi:hypothetical protein
MSRPVSSLLKQSLIGLSFSALASMVARAEEKPEITAKLKAKLDAMKREITGK